MKKSLESGQIFFSKRIRSNETSHFDEFVTRGLYVGVLLGEIPANDRLKDKDSEQLIHAVGLISFQDVERCLGKEARTQLIQYVANKV